MCERVRVVCVCGVIVASYLSLALTPNSPPPLPSAIPPLSCLSIRLSLKFGGAKTIKRKVTGDI